MVAIFAVLLNPDTGSAADPFYNRLLEDGIQAHDRGDHALAVKNLRLACFGLLDEPNVLARGLTYLALAQAEIGDDEPFSRTFRRILEIENRFQAFSPLDLDADLRQAFEAHLHRLIAVDVLDRSPAFHQLARRKLEEQIHAMAPAELRLELERLVAAEPDDPTWGLLLAELKLDSGELEDVLATTDRVLASLPGLERALCLRGRAGMASGACGQALVDVESCQELIDRTALLEARLRCLISAGDWPGASTLLAEVPADRQRKAPFRQLARDVRKGLKSRPRGPGDVSEAAPTAGPTTEPDAVPSTAPGLPETEDAMPEAAAPEDAVPEDAMPEDAVPEDAVPEDAVPDAMMAEDPWTDDPATWPPELRTELERAREIVPVGSRAQLEEALASVLELADLYRQLTEPQHLAAEIAYRLSRWQEAVTFFQRGGEPSDPDRLFYLSVALFKTGEQAEARRALEKCLPSLEMTAFVRSYAAEILGGDDDGRVDQGTG